jgi:hypothetical protein
MNAERGGWTASKISSQINHDVALGWQQQMSTLPSAGASTGSGL